MSKINLAVEEYRASEEYNMLTKRYAQVEPYNFTAEQHRNCLSIEARSAYVKAESIALKYGISTKELIDNV